MYSDPSCRAQKEEAQVQLEHRPAPECLQLCYPYGQQHPASAPLVAAGFAQIQRNSSTLKRQLNRQSKFQPFSLANSFGNRNISTTKPTVTSTLSHKTNCARCAVVIHQHISLNASIRLGHVHWKTE